MEQETAKVLEQEQGREQSMSPAAPGGRAAAFFRAAGNFLSSFITALIALLAVFLIVMKLVGWNLFSIDSPSMSPQYPVNALVVVEPAEPADLAVGDVVTYVLNEDGVLVTHRVVAIDATARTVTTKGDANRQADAPVMWDNVVGRVCICIPALGRPLRYLTDDDNLPVVIVLIAALFLLSLAWDWWERRHAKRTQAKHSAARKRQRS